MRAADVVDGELTDFHGTYINLQGARCSQHRSAHPTSFRGASRVLSRCRASCRGVLDVDRAPGARRGAHRSGHGQAQACGRQVSFGLRTHLVGTRRP